jgi:hypothetical protein
VESSAAPSVAPTGPPSWPPAPTTESPAGPPPSPSRAPRRFGGPLVIILVAVAVVLAVGVSVLLITRSSDNSTSSSSTAPLFGEAAPGEAGLVPPRAIGDFALKPTSLSSANAPNFFVATYERPSPFASVQYTVRRAPPGDAQRRLQAARGLLDQGITLLRQRLFKPDAVVDTTTRGVTQYTCIIGQVVTTQVATIACGWEAGALAYTVSVFPTSNRDDVITIASQAAAATTS